MSSESATLLVVDDNTYNQDLLSKWLSKLGYRVLTANHGREALAQLEQVACDLLLLDIMMPEMNGYQLLEKLKADPRWRWLPVIVISSVDEIDSIVKCIELGAEDYLFKPFNRVLLRARLSAALEKKRLREQEARYLQQMQAAQKLISLGTLAAGVAHEMNSPLQVVTGMCETLLIALDQGDNDPAHLRHYADLILRNAWRCAKISTALRTYSQAAPDMLTPHDLNPLVEEALLLWRAQTLAPTTHPIVIETELAPDLPPLECDRGQIIQGLLSLLSNAHDAMPDGGRLTVRTAYLPDQQLLQLQVADTGVGIPATLQDRIFEPFFTTKPVGRGQGLGLAVLAGIVKAHAGQIEVHSLPGQGATFTLRLPEKAPRAEAGVKRKPGGRFDDTFAPPAPTANAPADKETSA